MFDKTFARGLLAVALLLAVSAEVRGQEITYDPISEYSNVNNPNGVWSYGWLNNSQFQLFVSNGPQGSGTSPNWYGPLTSPATPGISYPVVWLNTGSPMTGVQTGQLSLHPGPDGEDAILRWTAPSDVNGLCSIQGQFLPGDSGIMQVAIFENSNWASPLWTSTDSGTFNLSESLTAGNTIDFAVYGGFFNGNTPLEATITAPVPEPSTLALLIVGAAGLLAFGWRKKRQVAGES